MAALHKLAFVSDGTQVISHLIKYACDAEFVRIWTYADGGTLGFFYKQGFEMQILKEIGQ